MELNIIVATIIGKPNAGKSSLINNLLNYDFSIVTRKEQTTRDQIVGIYYNEEEQSQFVFVDTPGIHKSATKFGTKLNEASFKTLEGIDLVLFLSPMDKNIETIDEFIMDKIANVENRIALITKIDLVKDYAVVEERAKYLKNKGFKAVIAYSVYMENTKSILLEEIKKYSYKGEPLYELDYFTDKSMRFIAKEFIRKSAIENLHQEVPHNLAVEINEYNEKTEDRKTEIKATIYVTRDSHKSIVIGEAGQSIKKISMEARKNLEKFLDESIILVIKVKTNKNWINSDEQIKKMGY